MSESNPIRLLNDNDVPFCDHCRSHRGYKNFELLVCGLVADGSYYPTLDKDELRILVDKINHYLASLNPPGRFLEGYGPAGIFHKISQPSLEQKIHEKLRLSWIENNKSMNKKGVALWNDWKLKKWRKPKDDESGKRVIDGKVYTWDPSSGPTGLWVPDTIQRELGVGETNVRKLSGSNGRPRPDDENDDEDQMLRLAMEKSLVEHQRDKERNVIEEKMLKMAMEFSLHDEPTAHVDDEHRKASVTASSSNKGTTTQDDMTITGTPAPSTRKKSNIIDISSSTTSGSDSESESSTSSTNTLKVVMESSLRSNREDLARRKASVTASSSNNGTTTQDDVTITGTPAPSTRKKSNIIDISSSTTSGSDSESEASTSGANILKVVMESSLRSNHEDLARRKASVTASSSNNGTTTQDDVTITGTPAPSKSKKSNIIDISSTTTSDSDSESEASTSGADILKVVMESSSRSNHEDLARRKASVTASSSNNGTTIQDGVTITGTPAPSTHEKSNIIDIISTTTSGSDSESESSTNSTNSTNSSTMSSIQTNTKTLQTRRRRSSRLSREQTELTALDMYADNNNATIVVERAYHSDGGDEDNASKCSPLSLRGISKSDGSNLTRNGNRKAAPTVLPSQKKFEKTATDAKGKSSSIMKKNMSHDVKKSAKKKEMNKQKQNKKNNFKRTLIFNLTPPKERVRLVAQQTKTTIHMYPLPKSDKDDQSRKVIVLGALEETVVKAVRQLEAVMRSHREQQKKQQGGARGRIGMPQSISTGANQNHSGNGRIREIKGNHEDGCKEPPRKKRALGRERGSETLTSTKGMAADAGGEEVECPICYDQVDARTAVRIPNCGHIFCLQCFQSYVQAQVDAGNANELICPMPRTECGKRMCQSVLEEALDDETLVRVERCRRTAFVMENKDCHFCPTPNCSNILFWREEHNGQLPIGDCFECGKLSCLKCKVTPYHTNQTCEEWQQNEERMKQRQLSPMYRQCQSPGFENPQSDLCVDQRFQSLIYQRPINQPSSSSLIDRSRAGETLNHAFTPTSEEWMVNLGIRQCRRCGHGVQKAEGGCYKMKCRCGYRFCFNCGSENAQCNCTPTHHGFTDNITGCGDFAGLREVKSYT